MARLIPGRGSIDVVMLRDAQKMCNQVQNDRAVSIRHYEHHNSKTIALQRFRGLVGEDFGRFLSKPG